MANLSPEEFVQITERLGGNKSVRNQFEKVFKKIIGDNDQNEYNRTKIKDRYNKKNVGDSSNFDLN